MNKLLLSGVTTFAALAVVVGGTTAFFSSQASVTGNTLAAGTMNLLLTEAEGGNSPSATKSDIWEFDEMAPGGTPEQASVWLRNSGSVPGETLGIAIANGWTNPSNIAAQMRITEMSLDGNNLLEGGAGANLGDYEAPTSCDQTLSSPANVNTAISSATAGDVICLEAGTYNEFTVDKGVTVAGLNRPSSGQAAVIQASAGTVKTLVNITSSDATVTGLQIDGSVTSFTGSQLAGIKLDPDTTAIDDVTVSYNYIKDLTNTTSGVAVKGIQTFDNGTIGITNSVIAHNYVSDITASTNGGYGIQTVSDLDNVAIEHNTVRNIDGAWGAGIALDAKTNVGNTNVSVTDNQLTNNIWGAPELDGASVSIQVEHLVDQTGFTIERNNILGLLHGGGSAGAASGPDVDAQNNWWGDFDPSDQIFGPVNTSNFAGGPFEGFVNGNDFNSNGFADLGDLRNDPVTNSDITLEEYTGTEDKEFVMGVQLDGPTTDNSFQGLTLDDMELVFTLEQI
jgi:predicted ribosomally synthesized peptide with SipW-like signal peptide